MIVLSLNSRGMGSTIKHKVVRELVSLHKVDIMCIQETKLEDIDTQRCRSIWGDVGFRWEFCPAINRGGGLVTIWKEDLF